MSRNRTPEALREVRGMDKKNPSRRAPDQPEPNGGIGPAPAHLNVLEQEIWDEIVGHMHAGVMGQAERVAFEQIVRLTYEMRVNFAEMPTSRVQALTSLLSKFGMTPTDRAKIVVPKGEKKNGFAALLDN